MAVQNILDVEINTEKFDAFLADFEKHKASVGALPGVWAKLGKSIDAGGVAMEKIVAATTATAAATAAMAAAQEKFGQRAQSNVRVMEALKRNTTDVVRSLADGAGALLKWASLSGAVGGLLGAGSLWGIDRLALAAGGARRSALGLGVTSGEQQALGISFGRVLDNPGGLLENIANAQNDPREAAPFLALGVRDYATKDAAQLAPELLDAIRNRAKATPANVLGPMMEALGATKFASMDEIRRMRDTPDEEWRGLKNKNEKSRDVLAVDPRTQAAWQGLTTQLNLAGQQIENTLIRGLVGLAGPLEHVSEGAVRVVDAFARSPDMKKWITEAGDGLDWFAKFIGTPAFKADVDGFVHGVGALGKAVGGAVDFFSHLPWNSPDVPTNNAVRDSHPTMLGKWLYDSFDRLRGLDNGLWGKRTDSNDPAVARWLGDPKNDSANFTNWWGRHVSDDPKRVAWNYFIAHGRTAAETAGIFAGVQEESGWNPSAVSKDGGAHGFFQLRGERLANFRKSYGVDPDKADIYKQLNFAELEMESGQWRETNTPNEKTDPGAGYASFRRGYERPSDAEYAQHAARGMAEARDYYNRYGGAAVNRSPAPVTVNLDVHNPTGSHFATSGAQAAVP